MSAPTVKAAFFDLRWPLWPVLPVKRKSKDGGWPELGSMIYTKTGPYKVYKSSELGEMQPGTGEAYEYATLDAVEADGWVVD